MNPAGGADPSRKGRRLLWRGVQLVLTVGVTWLIVDQVGVTLEEALALEAALPAVRPGLLLLSTLVLLGGFLAAARLWGRMSRELGGGDPGFWGSIRIVLTANLGRYVPGKVWQMAGLAFLSRRQGISVAAGTMAGVLGQTFLLAGAGILGLPLLLTLGGNGQIRGPLVLVGLLAMVLVVTLPPVLRTCLRGVFRLARLPSEQVPRVGPLFGPRWLTVYAMVWVVYGTAFLLLVRGLGFQGGFMELAPPLAAAYLLGYLAVFAPAGIGVREGFLIAFLRPELGGAAVGVAVLARVWMTVVELLPAGAVALWEIYRRPSGTPGQGEETTAMEERVDG